MHIKHWTRSRRAVLVLLWLSLLPAACLAHSEGDDSGFITGLLHPVLGLDHVLAMVAVGIVSAQLGGANIWRVPLAFVTAMIIGGTAGALNMPLPYGEIGIAVSVVFLGITMVYASQPTNPMVPFLFVCFFGFCHGHAHGVEMPNAIDPALYTLGFVTSTALLHILGVVIGMITLRREHWTGKLRYAGACVAGVGAVFLLGKGGLSIG
jgi:urease accessory protein